jgi:hypothetical protein
MTPNNNILTYFYLYTLKSHLYPNYIYTPNTYHFHVDCDIFLSKYIKCLKNNNDNCHILHENFVKCLYYNPSIYD